MTHPSRQEIPAAHEPGVFIEYDQAKMPEIPSDWIGLKVYDAGGVCVGLSFVPREHNDRLLHSTATAYHEARGVLTAAFGPRPRLERLK